MKLHVVKDTPRKIQTFAVEGQTDVEELLTADDVDHVVEIFNTPLTGSYNWNYTIQEDRIRKLYELGKSLNWNAEMDIDWEQPIPEGDLPELMNMTGYGPFEALNKEEKQEFIRHTNSWAISQFLHGEQGALLVASHEKDYYRFFGKSVAFDCLQNSLSFPSSLARQNVVAANTALLTIYEQQCKVLLENIEREDSFTHKIYRLLSQFDGGYPTLEETADILALSPRTLRRRLESEHTGYQKILDEVRQDQAIDLLTHSTLPLSTISFTLGFKDISNFRRAFIKWTGKNPLDYRES